MPDIRLLFPKICVLLDQSPAHSLAHLSRQFEVSPSAIQKIVSAMTNRDFTRFKDDILMAKFTKLVIARPGMSIKELSSRLGYKSTRSFAWQVRRACGASPARVRIQIASEFATQNREARPEANRLGAASHA